MTNQQQQCTTVTTSQLVLMTMDARWLISFPLFMGFLLLSLRSLLVGYVELALFLSCSFIAQSSCACMQFFSFFFLSLALCLAAVCQKVLLNAKPPPTPAISSSCTRWRCKCRPGATSVNLAVDELLGDTGAHSAANDSACEPKGALKKNVFYIKSHRNLVSKHHQKGICFIAGWCFSGTLNVWWCTEW